MRSRSWNICSRLLLPREESSAVINFILAYDLRPSSSSFVAELNGRGEIAQAIVTAIGNAGMQAVNLGPIPTPALANYALSLGKGSIMVTGSHIPFDLNGYKTYSSRGELLKEHEAPINQQVQQVRERLYAQPAAESLFDEFGFLKSGHQALPPEHTEARAAYIERFTHFFKGGSLGGKRVMVYQHSAVGRDLLAEILEHLGAEVVKAGRSDTFVPIDTENIDASALAVIQELVDKAVATHGPLYAVVSTDGDSDRPLILGADQGTSKVHFFGGDLVGMVVAEFLRADAVVVPISCNDAVDRGKLCVPRRAKDADRLAICDRRNRSGSSKRQEARLWLGAQWRFPDWLGSRAKWRDSESAPHEGFCFAYPCGAFCRGRKRALFGGSIRPVAKAVQSCRIAEAVSQGGCIEDRGALLAAGP